MYIEENMINTKLNLFIKNYEKIKHAKISWQKGMMQYSIALSSSIKNQDINIEKIEEAGKIIKENTGIFSNFRGHSMFYLASILSNKTEPINELKSILNIYDKLKENKFHNDAYLPFVAIIINENKNKISIDECIRKTKYVYDYMKKHHPFLTSSDDYCRAALIAIHSKDLDNDLEYIEESYQKLNDKGFFKSNNLQSLSHIMTFDKYKSDETINKVVRIKELLEINDCKVDGYVYSLIGAVSLIDCDEKTIVEQIKIVSDKLKEVKGFGAFSLGKSNRNMISVALVASCYSDSIGNDLSEISNNIFVEIIIAIEVATMISIISATTAASASASS